VLSQLLLLFILVPLVELALLLWLADKTSWLCTLWLVILTGVVGAWLARREGLRCLRAIQDKTARGELPADSLLDGLMILVAGAVLVTPGILTDLLGFALLIPPFRRVVRRWIKRRIGVRLGVFPKSGEWSFSNERPPAHDEVIDSRVIDVDHRRAEDDDR